MRRISLVVSILCASFVSAFKRAGAPFLARALYARSGGGTAVGKCWANVMEPIRFPLDLVLPVQIRYSKLSLAI
jgi:hypothetical protein